MYSLDVNFLKDRKSGDGTGDLSQRLQQPRSLYWGDKGPLAIGAVFLLLFPAIAAGSLVYFQSRQTKVEQEIQVLDGQIQNFNQQKDQIKTVEMELAQAKAETAALVSVFTRIKPWSAILQDLSDRIPKNVTITTLEQDGNRLALKGLGATYGDVNDFLLTLKQSQFLRPDATFITAAALQDFQVNSLSADELTQRFQETGRAGEIPSGYSSLAEVAKRSADTVARYDYPKVVNYTIVTTLNDVPAAQLIDYLASKGADGLVTRISTLEKTGAIKP